MKRISILNQQDSKLLFSVEDYGVYFLMPLEDLGRLSELSYEFFSFMLYYSTIQRQVPFLPCWMLPFCMTNTVKG